MSVILGAKNYGITALKAAAFAVNGMPPVKAWEVAVLETHPHSPSSQVKACPKSAFLGLAGAGAIMGIMPGEYTISVDNKRYAKLALELLRGDGKLADMPRELWRRVLRDDDKRHNGQMDVVVALWKAKKFVGQ